MQAYITWILRFRFWVLAATLAITALCAYQIKQLKVATDPDKWQPQQHPYIVTTHDIENRFGARYVVIVGVTARSGDVYEPSILAKIERMTKALRESPDVVYGSVLSVAARKVKSIRGNAEGMQVEPMMASIPRSRKALARLRAAIRANPAYEQMLVSSDGATAAVIADFKDPKGRGFKTITGQVERIAERERDASVDIRVGGLPFFSAMLEDATRRMAILFPLAVLVIGLIHFEAFRTLQGLILPLVTALLAVVWGVGIMGFANIPFDVFNSSTPVLILAVAAGHAVQILKRYYEEYARLVEAGTPPRKANHEAVLRSTVHIGPAMLMAGAVATLSFLSLAVFDISMIRTFGVLTALGILSALIIEMTFTPALRSVLPPPKIATDQREDESRAWDRISAKVCSWILGERKWLYAGLAAGLVICLLGIGRIEVDNSVKSYFSDDLPVRKDDDALNSRLAGTNVLGVLVEGDHDDALKNPAVLRGIESTQRFLETQAQVGKTLSIVDFIKRMNRAMNGDRREFDKVPETSDLVSQYLLLYSLSGEPGDFDNYVDYGYRSALIRVFFKTDSSLYAEAVTRKMLEHAKRELGEGMRVRIGGGLTQPMAITDAMVRGKLLNILQVSSLIFFSSALLYRSLAAGALVLAPLAAAVLAVFSVMGWAGIPLCAATATISALAVGIGADYAIYLIFRIREELAWYADIDAAMNAALRTAGKAVLYVSSAVAGGYSVLFLSFGMRMHHWCAALVVVAMIVSALATLLILPTLILTFRPAFIFGDSPAAWLPAARSPAQSR